jgi:hypothetical protein
VCGGAEELTNQAFERARKEEIKRKMSEARDIGDVDPKILKM